jgi:hypothetical protein
VLKDDEIWKATEQVWSELSSSKIAGAFTQAYRIGLRIKKLKANNLKCGNPCKLYNT